MDCFLWKTPVFWAAMLIVFFVCAACEEPDNHSKPDTAIPINAITINGGNLTIPEGGTVSLTATIKPENASNKKIIWSSDDEKIIMVSEAGLLTAVSVGETTVRAAAIDSSGITDSVTITVIYDTAETIIPFRWTFQDMVPGWIPYSSSNSAASTMNTDAAYQNGMILLGSRHPMRWMPDQSTPVSNFSAGCLQNTGDAEAFLEIANIQGPFKITFNYTNTTAVTGTRYPVLYVNRNKVKEGDPVALNNGLSTRRVLEYNYFWDDKADVQLGAVNAFRLFDVILGEVTAIPVNRIAISEGDFSLTAGAEKQLTADVFPGYATEKRIVWSSSNAKVATVNANGLVTGTGSGTAEITAAARDDSGVSESVTVNVTVVPVQSIVIPDGDFSLNAGYAKALTASFLPANASNKEINWSSSNANVATVSTNGLVTGAGSGTAAITAAAKDGSGVSCSVTVTVTFVYVQNISIAGGDFSLAAGNIRALTAQIFPDQASNKEVRWFSSSQNAAVSPAGVVTAVSPGTATISAVAQDGSGVTDSIAVTITASSGIMSPQEIFNALKGQKAVTYGWADMANGGTGLSYANPANLTLINDANYPVMVNKRTAFTNVINSDSITFIIISGDIDLSDGKINDNDKSWFDQFNPNPPYSRVNGDITFNIGSNTTLIGINNARIMFGGLQIRGKSNVIIRNVTFWDAHGSTANDTTKPGYSDSKAGIDALVIQGASNGVWVDHCKFTDGTCDDMIRNYNHDGALDIPQGKNITVSWTEFTNHDKVMLVAGSDSASNAVAEDRQITLHHNYFHATTQRMPRTRGTQMHVYNNYYNNIGVYGNNGSFMGPGWGAQFIVENNYFGSKLGNKNIEWFDTEPLLYPVKFYYAGNNIADANSIWWGRESNPKPWEPAYIYTLDDNAVLPASIPASAGPTLVFNK